MGTVDEKKTVMKRPPMRSSIACLRCRKSKIKCENDGGISSCETCIKQGKHCEYPEATPVPPKRADSQVNVKTERDGGPDRKRLKKFEDVSRMDNQYSPAAYADDVLSAHYLVETLWLQIFDLYKLHFATELPFLHMPTLKEKMGNKFRATAKDSSPDTNLVLLGVLTLTARFHPELVKYVTHTYTANPGPSRPRPVPSKADSSAASEYFAEALRKALGPLGISMTVATVERVQAFLMLGLYEWTQCRPKTGGLGAWMYVGVAIRMAQALGLGFGDKPGASRQSKQRTSLGQMSRASQPDPEVIIAAEIKRRTMWSCLILDRLLACGKERVSTIRSEDLQIQLPCNEISFNLSEDVKTGFLREPPDEQRLRDTRNNSVLSSFVRLVDLWGDISKYSFAGGRLTEDHPPWDERSRFHQLNKELQRFYSELPSTFTLSTSNYYKHDDYQASSVYVSLHMLGSVCTIMLHREYIPFLPIRCDKPVGPLDEPTFPEGKYDIPNGFWDDSAEQVFKAARDIVNLIETCRDRLPMSALVLFAIWTAAFVGQYAWHFPHMDQQGHMLPADDHESRVSDQDLDITKMGPTGVTYQTLNKISGWLKMATTYLTYFKEMDRYITQVKLDYHSCQRHASGNKTGQTDEGKIIAIAGGGLEEWKIQNAKIINNGMILAEDERHTVTYEGSDGQSRASTIERGSSLGPHESYATTAGDHVKTPRSMPAMFTAINSAALAPQHHSEPPPGPSPRHEILPEGTGASAAWSRNCSAPTHMSPSQPHQPLSPGVDVSHFILPTGQFMDWLNETESIRIADGLGGGDLQGFSYGDLPETNMPYFGGQNALLAQFGVYDS